MSLIPYHPQEGREIVLRHRNAIVVRDSTSHRLEIRTLTQCPTCQRPLPRSPSPERPYAGVGSGGGSSNHHPYDGGRDSYLNPDYFRMLQAGTQTAASANGGPSSPVRKHIRPALGGARGRSFVSDAVDIEDNDAAAVSHDDTTPATADFVSSTPDVSQAEGNKIRKQAFSPGYFKTFFKEEKVLGKGGKGVVLLVRHQLDDCDLGYYACKRVPVGDDHEWLEKVLVEVGLLNKLSHPNLVSYRHVWLESVRTSRFGPKIPCAFILQQYCDGGDLQKYLVGSGPIETTKEELKARARRRSKGQTESSDDLLQSGIRHLPLEEIYSLFRDITSGVAYLHSNEYIHRDLKPNNCLLHRDGQRLRCLISDFGEVQAENVVRKSTGSTGTISYCAPEVLRIDGATGRYGNFTTKSDMFSLGMILHFICFGKLPYRSANAVQEELEDVDELRAEITEWQGFQDAKRERPDLPPRLYTLLRKLLSLDPAERPSANDVLGAMRGENPFDTSRGERSQSQSPSLSMHGNRVQNLDSPAVPGTPVPSEPHKQFARARTGSSRPTSPRGPNFDHAVASASGTDRQFGDSSQVVTTTRFIPQPAVVVTEISDDHPDDAYVDAQERRRPSRALLMPPPRSRAAELRDEAYVMAAYLTTSLLGPPRDLANQVTRIGFFLVKMLTLTRPCWPYMSRLEVCVPLLMAAALDLRIPEAGSASMARRAAGDVIEFGPPRLRGLGWSVLLLAAHVLVVWGLGRWNALCVVPVQDAWTTW